MSPELEHRIASLVEELVDDILELVAETILGRGPRTERRIQVQGRSRRGAARQLRGSGTGTRRPRRDGGRAASGDPTSSVSGDKNVLMPEAAPPPARRSAVMTKAARNDPWELPRIEEPQE